MIYNTNPDPDYPVLSGPGFAQHTCQPYTAVIPNQQQYFYNGQTVMQPVGGVADSRRYDAPAPQISAMGAAPVQPTPAPTYGFNQLVESTRRNQGAPVQTAPVAQTNPWAVQPAAQPATIPAPTYATQPVNPNGGYYYSSMNDPRYDALRTCHPSVDKKQGVWGVQETYAPVVAPTVNWGAASVVPNNVLQYGYVNSQPMVTYPQISTTPQPIQPSWAEIAEANFGKK